MSAPDLFTPQQEPQWQEVASPEGKRIRWREIPGAYARADVGLEIERWEESYGWLPVRNWAAREWFWIGLRAGGTP